MSDVKKDTNTKNLEEKVLHKPSSLWDHYSQEDIKEAMDFNEDYKRYLDLGKTEREAVAESVRLLEENGFKDLSTFDSLSPGDKVYSNILGKGLLAAVLGQENVAAGFNIVGAHVDSPRVDLKPNPVYEDGEMSYFSTHYYGGIKNYQWTNIPLALHGVIYTQDGEKVEINIGEDENDPIFIFNDLLPHLGAKQMQKKASEVIEGEELRLLIGGTPYEDKSVGERYKLELLRLLNERYGIVERDFITAELSIVPAMKARDLGFDRSFVAAYGQDDRVCSYTALRAVMAVESPKRTTVVMLTDKEEIGSDGNTGAQSALFENFFVELFVKSSGEYNELFYRQAMAKSSMLSTDVTNAYDPVFASVSDPKNNGYCGRGIYLQKYTGSGGKYSASDANSEFMTAVAHTFDKSGIRWQAGELGRVDAGGGGTISKFAAHWGAQVLDAGVPVLSMHAPYEVCHKLDIYETFRGYAVFLSEMVAHDNNHLEKKVRLS